MSNVIRIKKGLDISLEGAATESVMQLPTADKYAVKPDDFKGFTPKLLVKQGDVVAAGSPLLFDKYRPEWVVTSPVSGTVSSINRGEKRKILEVVVTSDGKNESKEFPVKPTRDLKKEELTKLLLDSGLWNFIIQRPYGIVANPEDSPKSIFISGFDTAPLAPDMNFVLKKEGDNIQVGLEALAKLTSGEVNLSLNADSETGVLNKVKGAKIHLFEGPHPTGNVGVQINNLSPINKGEVVWTIDIQNLAILGRFIKTGKVDMTKTIALTGSQIENPQYYTIIGGASISSIVQGRIKPQKSGDSVRIISGNVLTGQKVEESGYIGFYSNQITVIPEGDKYEMLGWIAPRFNKFSTSRSYFSWLRPKKKYDLDTNMNGGERALVMTGIYEKYFPMNIYPIYLLKAIMAGDIDKMENLGIYEVIEEDIALCEFVDPSKTEMQAILREGINAMIKELN
ncbi:MAG: Na(+)-translocating NADH-quinone reductase subunit A [Rikenellaceae bacterium]|nr:Na(+)-translocating NADH-quinone reductase subunit A [Rikenellaceae bacterium]